MPAARSALFLIALQLSACSSAGLMPPAPSAATGPSSDAPMAQRSALRVPANVLAMSRRSRYATSAAPYPISALAYSTGASPYPISALAFAGAPPPPVAAACDATSVPEGAVVCKAEINLSDALNAATNVTPISLLGVQPLLLRAIYNIPANGGTGKTVAIVDAYDNPNAEADLAVYRSTFGIPACSTANGCFVKIPGSGRVLPKTNANWSIESSLDLDAVSAACMSCKIMLVEAASNQISDLAKAVDTAVAHGATVVSNSYGVAEASDNVGYASHFEHKGVPITAAAGDVGYGVQFPASVPTVTSVGGTSVQIVDAAGALQEVVWPMTGAGCSAFFAKPTWQHDTGCTRRTANDVAILADPADGLSVYDSTLPNTAHGGWSVIGGTSLGAPLVAAIFAMAATSTVGTNASIYAAAKIQLPLSPSLLDVTAGDDGNCAIKYLCEGVAGYDGPTGNGVPWGITAFSPAQ